MQNDSDLFSDSLTKCINYIEKKLKTYQVFLFIESSMIMRLNILKTALHPSICSFKSTGISLHGSNRNTLAELVKNNWKLLKEEKEQL